MLNEHDLKDFDVLPVRELYKVKPRSYVMVPSMNNEVIFMDHIDGMYSYCLTITNEVIHLAAWTDVAPLQKKQVDM
jgi:hypothetical protein